MKSFPLRDPYIIQLHSWVELKWCMKLKYPVKGRKLNQSFVVLGIMNVGDKKLCLKLDMYVIV